LGGEPAGGPVKMWFWGVVAALVPFGYGVVSLFTGHARLLGRGGESADFRGVDAIAVAIGYISIGAFLHFRYFWGLHPKISDWSQLLCMLSLLSFVGSFLFTLARLLL
jgi:hypothetical protein